MNLDISYNCINETYIIDEFATLSDSSLVQRVGDSVILCSICVDYENPVYGDFIPLTTQYLEKSYAIGKIPYGFLKKEGKPTQNEVLTSRLIDRTIRTLFKKEFCYQTQVTILVLSYDGKSDLACEALKLASLTLYLSSIPLKSENICSAIRILKTNEELKLCKNMDDLKDANCDILLCGIDNGINMIEMQTFKDVQNNISSEISINEFLTIMKFGKEHLNNLSNIYLNNFKKFQKQKVILPPISCIKDVDIIYDFESMLKEMSKKERHDIQNQVAKKVSLDINISFNEALQLVNRIKTKTLRNMILDSKKRADGRGLNDIRKIKISTGILPCTHGSAVFTRGQTQALATCTIGADMDVQNTESLQGILKHRIMLHYNFYPFSVGEASNFGATSRREIGHGNLALKALQSNILDDKTIRLVSEIFQSNGSSSMATICACSLALKSANIEMRNLVGGVAMGLIYENDQKYEILTDIMGIEDSHGDMDFKIAGSKLGFSAMQLDTKVLSLSFEIIENILKKARTALGNILTIMEQEEIVPNLNILPSNEKFIVPINKIADIIGHGGKIIKEIIDKFDVKIDLNKDSGEINIMASSVNNLNLAKNFILEILKQDKVRKDIPYKVGEIHVGIVKKILDYGILIELSRGIDGLLRGQFNISLGEKIEIRIFSIQNGKVQLSLI